MTDEMEPKLRYKTAMATMKSRYIPIRTTSCVQMAKGYIFDVYHDFRRYTLGCVKRGGVWSVTDLATGKAISRQYHKTRKAALERFFSGYEFRSWLKIVTNRDEWFSREEREFSEECERLGYARMDWHD